MSLQITPGVLREALLQYRVFIPAKIKGTDSDSRFLRRLLTESKYFGNYPSAERTTKLNRSVNPRFVFGILNYNGLSNNPLFYPEIFIQFVPAGQFNFVIRKTTERALGDEPEDIGRRGRNKNTYEGILESHESAFPTHYRDAVNSPSGILSYYHNTKSVVVKDLTRDLTSHQDPPVFTTAANCPVATSDPILEIYERDHGPQLFILGRPFEQLAQGPQRRLFIAFTYDNDLPPDQFFTGTDWFKGVKFSESVSGSDHKFKYDPRLIKFAHAQ